MMVYQRKVALFLLAVFSGTWALQEEDICDVNKGGACSSTATVEEDEDVLSALQLHRRVEGQAENVSLSLLSTEASSNAKATSKFVITTSVVTAAVGTAVVTTTASYAVNTIFEQIAGDDSFNKAVGPWGLPLTVAVINDTPKPVQYTTFDLRDGMAWGLPALRRSLNPGEMMEWFLYTHTTGVLASMLFETDDDETDDDESSNSSIASNNSINSVNGTSGTSSGRSWAIAAAQYRTGHWFTGCDRLRVNVKTDGSDATKGLCKSRSGQPGIRVKGGYEVAIFLNEAGKE